MSEDEQFARFLRLVEKYFLILGVIVTTFVGCYFLFEKHFFIHCDSKYMYTVFSTKQRVQRL